MDICCPMFLVGALGARSIMGLSWFIAGRVDRWSRLGISAWATARLSYDRFDGRTLDRNSGEYSRSTNGIQRGCAGVDRDLRIEKPVWPSRSPVLHGLCMDCIR